MMRLHRLMLAAAALIGATAPAAAAGPVDGEVTGVSVLSAPGRAEVVVNVRGAVQVRDFMLNAPDRLVLDVVGATLASIGGPYDGQKRAGVVNVRYSQFRPDVVRIVVHLDGVKDYQVARSDSDVRVSFAAAQGFAAWSSATAAPALAAAAAEPLRDVVEVRPAAEPEVKLTALKSQTGRLRLPGQQPRITVTWDRASIADVVAGFAAFSGRTIILGKDIKGEAVSYTHLTLPTKA